MQPTPVTGIAPVQYDTVENRITNAELGDSPFDSYWFFQGTTHYIQGAEIVKVPLPTVLR
jgi:hypothetical protein